jgi:pimeloyl-ACP methyl ester carboxylesterase
LETQSVYVNDSHAHYARAGNGESTLVVLHGWGASLKQWEWLLPIAANAGYTAYAVDLLGHGEAPRLPNNHTIEDYQVHLSQWMKALDIQHPILLGHSLGGYLSLEYALENPGAVPGLILVDPLYSYHQFDHHRQSARRLLSRPGTLTVLEFFFRYTPIWLIEAGHRWNRSESADVPATLRRQVALDYKRADPHILRTLLSIGDLRPYLGQVTAPILVAWGCRDLLLPHDSFETLVDLLPAAWGHCFTNMGHNPHLTHAPRFTELILTFLRQVKGDNGSSGITPTDTRQLWIPFTVMAPTDR